MGNISPFLVALIGFGALAVIAIIVYLVLAFRLLLLAIIGEKEEDER